jgi:hypothetical protein
MISRKTRGGGGRYKVIKHTVPLLNAIAIHLLTVTKYVLMQVIVPSFFFTTHADPLKAQLIMITEAVKVIRLLSQLKSTYVPTFSYECTLFQIE